MLEGRVKWYDPTKGFGFIEVEGKKDVFVHRSGLERPFDGLEEGQEVVFDVKDSEKGEVAINVK
ncbi:cold-shock protein [Prolixibacteraceae bacterium JC049]|nr:cold-shock protein [Prolixibacteraceae bacterium JC049]